ncbi:hypothetical protein ACFX2B_033401 [Malus domestica]
MNLAETIGISRNLKVVTNYRWCRVVGHHGGSYRKASCQHRLSNTIPVHSLDHLLSSTPKHSRSIDVSNGLSPPRWFNNWHNRITSPRLSPRHLLVCCFSNHILRLGNEMTVVFLMIDVGNVVATTRPLQHSIVNHTCS